MHDCDTYFNAWPRFMTRTIYVLGGPLMTTQMVRVGPFMSTYLVRPDHLCTRTKYLVTEPNTSTVFIHACSLCSIVPLQYVLLMLTGLKRKITCLLATKTYTIDHI